MPTNTAVVIPPSRQDPRQVINSLKKVVNFNDPGLANGVAFDNGLPSQAFISLVQCEIVAVFDATPILVVGTVGTAYNNIIAAGDVDETALAVTAVTRSYGRSLTAAGEVVPYVKFTSAGSTVGQAVIMMWFDGGWTS